MSNYAAQVEVGNEGVRQFHYVRCPHCKGSGIDPDCAKSHQDDEWDCLECSGYGDIEIPD